ncbi:MAG: SDR family NAD(P)-dependent oxidoreductase, partial [Enhygromyxa sp.]
LDVDILPLLASDEPQFAVRGGELLVPRLALARSPDVLIPPPSSDAWFLDTVPRGTLENLTFVDAPELLEPLPPGHVRIEVKATGLNFRDVLNALGMYPGDPGPLGYEGAGIVTAVADDVTSLNVGDSVFGILRAGFASHSVVDHRFVTTIPDGWSFTQAASTPLVFLTAYYAFVDLAHLKPGERVLIHAATGGVGMAATQLARHFGAEVFGTGSTPKWPVLRELGFDDAHISNSRTLDFETDFLEATKGEGVDVILDALAREFVDASLRLLPRGGRFLEMGKTDVRDPEQVAKDHPGVTYRAFDLIDAGLDRIQQMLRELVALFESGTLTPLPTTIYDLRRAPEAFRFVGQAKHVGKLVLTAPPALDPNGTVLITGGTGALGALVARHLVEHHGVRQLLLSSRRGLAAPGAADLQAALEALGARVEIFASDVAHLEQAKALLDTVSADHPLTAVFHTAGVLDDGLLTALTPERLAKVFAPKVDAALNLHQLTKDLPLAAFVLFSSVAGVLGSPAQASYAAANAFLDALCAHRQAIGLPAQSLAWGPWAEGGMAARLSDADIARMKRSGFPPITVAEGLQLLDAALARPEPALVPVRLDTKALAGRSDLPRLFSGLVRASPQRAATSKLDESQTLTARIAATPSGKRLRLVTELVLREAALVLGAPSPNALGTKQALQELGLDSLMAVELRNRLQSSSGLRLPATFLFDYPTVTAIAEYVLGSLAPNASEPEQSKDPDFDEGQLRKMLATIPIATLRESSLLSELIKLAEDQSSPASDETSGQTTIDEMSVDDLINFVLPDSN